MGDSNAPVAPCTGGKLALAGGSFGPDLESTPGFQGYVVYALHADVEKATFGMDIHVVKVTTVAGSLVPDLATDQRLQLEDEQIYPRFSPDGTQIVFVVDLPGSVGSQLSAVAFDDVAGTLGTPQLLLDGVANVRIFGPPTWSPDGKWIAFLQQDRNKSETWAIFRIRPDGTGLTKVAKVRTAAGTGGTHWNPAWVSDID